MQVFSTNPLKTSIAEHDTMERLTGCISGGLHPLRYCYVDEQIPVYIDQAVMGAIKALPLDKQWLVVGGGTPNSALFVPSAAFRRYAISDAIIGNIIEAEAEGS